MPSIFAFLGFSDCCGSGSRSDTLRIGYAASSNGEIPKQTFIKLAKNSRFDDIIDILRNSNNHLDIGTWLADATRKVNSSNNNRRRADGDIYQTPNALHVLVYYRPPVLAVEKLIESMKYLTPGFVPEASRDLKGQTPLHIAVRRGCNVAVIERLLKSTVAFPAAIIDLMNRCPLHWACCMDVPTSSNGSTSGIRTGPTSAFRQNMLAIVTVLLQAYPQAADIEDVNSQTPLDLACYNRLDKDILLLLLKAARDINHGNTGSSNSRSTEEMSLSASVTSGDGFPSGHSVPRLVRRMEFDEYSDTFSDSISSIGDGGVSVYRPESVQHEQRNFITW
jgi:ankyrin repeat protein